ncbi:hypothetical protein KEM55_004544 [Ascosphaera atra]|nr:hypothetical protein KEM55_004544 [Ascosphaera atra]
MKIETKGPLLWRIPEERKGQASVTSKVPEFVIARIIAAEGIEDRKIHLKDKWDKEIVAKTWTGDLSKPQDVEITWFNDGVPDWETAVLAQIGGKPRRVAVFPVLRGLRVEERGSELLAQQGSAAAIQSVLG